MKPVIPVFTDEPDRPRVDYAADQPQYKTLPAVHLYGERATCSRWELAPGERVDFARTGTMRFYMWTFDNEPQSYVLSALKPDTVEKAASVRWGVLSVRCSGPDGIMLTYWKPDDEQRALIIEQGYIYLLVLNEMQPLMPTLIEVEEPER